MKLLNQRTFIFLLSLGACVMTSGCFSCTETTQPSQPVVVQPVPTTPSTVVVPAPAPGTSTTTTITSP
jgi:hypothetical protein